MPGHCSIGSLTYPGPQRFNYRGGRGVLEMNTAYPAQYLSEMRLEHEISYYILAFFDSPPCHLHGLDLV